MYRSWAEVHNVTQLKLLIASDRPGASGARGDARENMQAPAQQALLRYRAGQLLGDRSRVRLLSFASEKRTRELATRISIDERPSITLMRIAIE